MRIAHIYKDSYPPVHGGIEQHIDLLSRGQAARGHAVRVIVAGGRRGEEHVRDGVEVVRLPELARAASSPITAAFLRIAPRVDADVVHFHHPNPIGELAHRRFPSGAARVVTYHADITRQRALGTLYAPLRRQLLQQADAVIAATTPMATGSPVLSTLGRHVDVLPYGVEPTGAPTPAATGRQGLLFVGRLREYKGVLVLLRALQRTSTTLRVVGRGPMLEQVEAEIDRLGIADRVTLLADVSAEQLDAEYRRARALVLPSILRSEAFGLVIAEALVRGTPAISTELGTGTSWVNQHDRTGLVVPPGDVDALAAACERLAHDDESWDRWATGAVDWSRRFTADRMIDDTLAVYERVRRSR